METEETRPSEPSSALTTEDRVTREIEEAAEERPVNYLVFPVGGVGILIEQQGEMEFLENQTPFHIPNNHPNFRGLINRRGSLVPIFEIRNLIQGELPPSPDESGILVIGSGDDAVGIILDSVPYRLAIRQDYEVSPPDKLTRAFGEFLGPCYVHNGAEHAFVALDRFVYHLIHHSDN